MEKLKEIEFTFRGEYLDGCKGRKKKKKHNFEKNPLENLDLPYHELFESCLKIAEQKSYDLRSIYSDKGFIKKIEMLTSSYIDIIEFHLSKTQAEIEKAQEEELSSDSEQEGDGDMENEKKDEAEENKEAIPKKNEEKAQYHDINEADEDEDEEFIVDYSEEVQMVEIQEGIILISSIS